MTSLSGFVKIEPIVKLGVHVSIAGEICEAVDRAKALDCNTFQIFSRNPRIWERKTLTEESAQEFKKRLKQSKIIPVFIHTPYLTNLASPDKKIYQNSIHHFIEYIKEADALGVKYLVTHMGSHKKTGEAKGVRRFAHALNIILDRTKKSKTKLLLENTAGSGSWLGYTFLHHQAIIKDVSDKSRVGICMDTCHAYSAGYDIATETGLEQMINEIEEGVGLDTLELIHLNDTQDVLASKKDRHASIGKGLLGLEAFRRIVNHRKFEDVPFILETPRVNQEDDKVNLNTVRKLYAVRT